MLFRFLLTQSKANIYIFFNCTKSSVLIHCLFWSPCLFLNWYFLCLLIRRIRSELFVASWLLYCFMKWGNSKNNHFIRCLSISIVYVNICVVAEDKSISLKVYRILKTSSRHVMSQMTNCHLQGYLDEWHYYPCFWDCSSYLVYQVLLGMSRKGLRWALVLQNCFSKVWWSIKNHFWTGKNKLIEDNKKCQLGLAEQELLQVTPKQIEGVKKWKF